MSALSREKAKGCFGSSSYLKKKKVAILEKVRKLRESANRAKKKGNISLYEKRIAEIQQLEKNC